MKIRVSAKPLIALESVAMTDIVMNLFIFFFISFSLLYTFSPQKESRIDVSLPGASAGDATAASRPLVVSVSAGNEVFFGTEPVPLDRVGAEIAARAKRDKPPGVVVRADKAASVDVLVQVLDAARRAGLAKLGVAVERAGG